jgi:hypothetical protein
MKRTSPAVSLNWARAVSSFFLCGAIVMLCASSALFFFGRGRGIDLLFGQAFGLIPALAISWWVGPQAFRVEFAFLLSGLFILALAAFKPAERSVLYAGASLKDISDPVQIDKALRQNPSNIYLRIMAKAAEASQETDLRIKRLLGEIASSSVSNDINFSNTTRAELEVLLRDIKQAEENASTALSLYDALLKAERDKVRDFARSIVGDGEFTRSILARIDSRRAKLSAVASRIIMADKDMYRALREIISIMIDQYGSLTVGKNGKFLFANQTLVDRYSVTARSLIAAMKDLAGLIDESKSDEKVAGDLAIPLSRSVTGYGAAIVIP